MTKDSIGTRKNYSIIALESQKAHCLLADRYGYVRMTGEGDITLDVEDYDSMYDSASGILVGHTWKDTYLFYDKNTYKEYGAVQISEEEYAQYKNAQLIRNKIAYDLNQPDTVSLQYSYFVRANGIMHIQCDVYDRYGDIYYGYYTVRYENNVLDKELGQYHDGCMAPAFSNLEVVFDR